MCIGWKALRGRRSNDFNDPSSCRSATLSQSTKFTCPYSLDVPDIAMEIGPRFRVERPRSSQVLVPLRMRVAQNSCTTNADVGLDMARSGNGMRSHELVSLAKKGRVNCLLQAMSEPKTARHSKLRLTTPLSLSTLPLHQNGDGPMVFSPQPPHFAG